MRECFPRYCLLFRPNLYRTEVFQSSITYVIECLIRGFLNWNVTGSNPVA